MTTNPHLLGLLPEDLAAHLSARGISATDSEVRRTLSRAFAAFQSSNSIGNSTGNPIFHPTGGRNNPVSKKLTAAIQSVTDQSHLEILERVTDPSDAFVKYLFRSPDGALHEAVRIPLHKPGCYSVCLSSQVGCAMGCVFCATGRLGLSRNLLAWEMVAAFLAVRAETPGRVKGAVFQGQGEPFHNYEEVIQAARVLSNPNCARVSGPAITISTVGLVPQIHRYAREGHPYRLIISLTSAVAAKRARLLPVAGRFSLEELAGAIRAYANVTRGRVTVAWVLMKGENHADDEVQALTRLLGDLPLRINLIDVNDARENGFQQASDAERSTFMTQLQVLNVPIVRRYSGGASRHAACGMLAATRFTESV